MARFDRRADRDHCPHAGRLGTLDHSRPVFIELLIIQVCVRVKKEHSLIEDPMLSSIGIVARQGTGSASAESVLKDLWQARAEPVARSFLALADH